MFIFLIGIYTTLYNGVTTTGVLGATCFLEQTMVLVLKYTSLRMSDEDHNDLQDHHPLVRCLANARFPTRIPYFMGLTTWKPFHVLRCTNELALWPLQDLTGHAMCIPERTRLPFSHLVDDIENCSVPATNVNLTMVPTPIILDVTTSAIHQRYHRSRI